MLNFSEFFWNFVRISEHFLSVFQKLFQNFSGFFESFIKFPSTVSLQIFQNFYFELILWFLHNSYIKVWNLKISEKFFSIFYKTLSKCLKNLLQIFRKLFLIFLEKYL